MTSDPENRFCCNVWWWSTVICERGISTLGLVQVVSFAPYLRPFDATMMAELRALWPRFGLAPPDGRSADRDMGGRQVLDLPARIPRRARARQADCEGAPPWRRDRSRGGRDRDRPCRHRIGLQPQRWPGGLERCRAEPQYDGRTYPSRLCRERYREAVGREFLAYLAAHSGHGCVAVGSVSPSS